VTFWVLLALVVALFALRRALGAERAAAQLRHELGLLRASIGEAARLRAEEAARQRAAAGVDGAPSSDTVPVSTRASPDAPPTVRPSDVAARVEDAGRAFDAPPPLPAQPSTLLPTSEPQAESQPSVRPSLVRAWQAARSAESLETRIGGRWLLYIGIVSLLVGASYFVKYAFDNDWISESLRVVLGLLAGSALVAIGQRFVSAGYALYGQALAGGGLGILYLSIFAAHRWYALVDRPPAFLGLVAITAAGAWLADRHRSQPLALIAAGAGFATPFLIGGENHPALTFFTYLLILVLGILYLAIRRNWALLNLVSYSLTVLTIASWAERNYHPREWLTTELFLTTFLVVFMLMLRASRRARAGFEGAFASLASLLLSLAPVLYHFASIAVLGRHRGGLLVYLIAFSVAGVIAAKLLGMVWLRLLVWVGVAVPFLGFVAFRLSSGWLVATWVTLAAIHGVHLLAQAQSLDDSRPAMPAADIVLLHANGLWALLAMWGLLAPRASHWTSRAAFGLALFYALMAALARQWHREAALHAAALAGALLAVACAMEFRGPWLAIALAAEGAAVIWLGSRAGRSWVSTGGAILLAMASYLAALQLARPAPVGTWPIANARTLACLFVVFLLYVSAFVWSRAAHRAGRSAGLPAAAIVGANLLTLGVISAEITTFFNARAWNVAADAVAGGGDADLARQLTLSIAWAGYAVALVAAGLRWKYRPVRYLAIVLFAATIAKVLLVDLARLDRVYWMLSVIGLGILLLMASFLYQRLQAQQVAQEAGPPPESSPGPELHSTAQATRGGDPGLT
jgi:uncharacterized membrane protein